MDRDSIGPKSARKIADTIGVRYKWLRTGEGPIWPEPSQPTKNGGPRALPHSPVASDACKGTDHVAEVVWVPKAVAKLSAGGGFMAEEGGLPERYAFRLDWLRMVASAPHKVILLDVQGDSMVPTLYDKDTILIDQGRTEIHGGGLFAIGIGGVLQVKRLELRPKTIRIISDNQTLYPPFEVAPDEIRVLGQMIWFARTVV